MVERPWVVRSAVRRMQSSGHTGLSDPLQAVGSSPSLDHVIDEADGLGSA